MGSQLRHRLLSREWLDGSFRKRLGLFRRIILKPNAAYAAGGAPRTPMTGLLVKPLGDHDSGLMTLPRFALYQRAIAIAELSSERSNTLAVALARVSVGGLLHLEYEDIGALGPATVDDEIGYNESLTVVVPIVGALIGQAQPLGGGSGSVVFNVNGVLGKRLLEVHRQARGNAALAEVVFEEMPIALRDLLQRFAQSPLDLSSLHWAFSRQAT